jgi:citrate synthase
MGRDTLTVTDNRTGQKFEVAIENGAVRATDLTEPSLTSAGPGLVIYDPGLAHTAICSSSITNIELEPGLLEHRGFRIEDLVEKSTYLEVTYLLLNGELPTADQFSHFQGALSRRKFVHENVKSFIQGFRYDAQPMAMLAAAVGALGSFYPDAGEIDDVDARTSQIMRLVAKMPTLGAYAFRHGNGQPFVHPSDDLSHTGNLLSMMFRMSELQYLPSPKLERALDVLLMVHADHEQSAATTAVRAVGSAHVDPYAAVAAGVYALSGPMRGNADRDTLRMLHELGTVEAIPAFLQRVKAGEERLFGFGHWVYRAVDPRAKILRGQLDTLYEDRSVSPLLAVADELARQAGDDEYFVSRGIHPNVDLYSGLTYQAIGISEPMFGVMFAIARSAGWIAQWLEMLTDAEQTTVRPRQLYVGPSRRAYVPAAERG